MFETKIILADNEDSLNKYLKENKEWEPFNALPIYSYNDIFQRVPNIATYQIWLKKEV